MIKLKSKSLKNSKIKFFIHFVKIVFPFEVTLKIKKRVSWLFSYKLELTIKLILY